MSERDDAIEIRLSKARECLAGAESEYAARRYHNVANRCYYVAFQAAIGALLHAGIQPLTRDGSWRHEFVQSQFNGVLVGRRKLYASELRTVLTDLIILRDRADYSLSDVTELPAARMLRRTRVVVAPIGMRTRGRA